MNELDGRHVVITGGRGALGAAVVEAFVGAGAVCHLPERIADHVAPHPQVVPVSGIDLTDEAGVTAFYAALPSLWASVHVAGGFSAAPLLQTTLSDLRLQMELNLTTAFLCC